MNQQIFSFLHSFANQNQFLDWLIIFLAEYLIFILALIAIVLILKEKDWRRRAYFLALVVISTILSRGIVTELVQVYYPTPRPFVAMNFVPLVDHAPTSSFPSGHLAFFSVVLSVWVLDRKWGIIFLVGTLLIGAARVVSGIHWPLDILGGATVGTASFLAAYYALKLKGLTPHARTGN